MNFKKRIYIVSIGLFLFLGAALTWETYSRYAQTFSLRGTTETAKWSAALKDGEKTLEKDFELSFVSAGNENVAPGKLAPGASGEARLTVDLAGTEVSVDYNITVDESSLKNQIGASDIRLDMWVVNPDGSQGPIEFGKDTYVPLDQRNSFTEENGTLEFCFALDWDGNDANNDNDTALALKRDPLRLPVSVTIKQHNANDANRKVTSNLSYLETTETKPRNTGADIESRQDVLSDNPERGFYSSSNLKLKEDGKTNDYCNTKSNTSRLLYLKVDLSAFSGSMNGKNQDLELTPAALSALEQVLEEIKQNNNTVVLRFVYDNGATGIAEKIEKFEPGQEMLLRHIQQLGPVFRKYASTIDVIQVGFYGLWGEAYYNTDAAKTPSHYRETIPALLEATAGTDITVAVRTPEYYSWYRGVDIGTIATDLTTSREDAYRVGIFNDAYGAGSDDKGTYHDRDAETAWLRNQASHTFFGGEAIVDAGYQEGNPSSAIGPYNTESYFIPEAFKIHTSYLNWEWNQALHRQWAKQPYSGGDPLYQGKSALTYIENHLGYRFVVREVRTYGSATRGETLPIDITVENVGFANLIKGKRADIVLTDSSGNIVQTYEGVGIDARDFLSRTTIKKSVSVPLPEELEAGEYKVYFRLSTGELLNNGAYYGAIRFANDGMYDETLAANYLATVTVS